MLYSSVAADVSALEIEEMAEKIHSLALMTFRMFQRNEGISQRNSASLSTCLVFRFEKMSFESSTYLGLSPGQATF